MTATRALAKIGGKGAAGAAGKLFLNEAYAGSLVDAEKNEFVAIFRLLDEAFLIVNAITTFTKVSGILTEAGLKSTLKALETAKVNAGKISDSLEDFSKLPVKATKDISKSLSKTLDGFENKISEIEDKLETLKEFKGEYDSVVQSTSFRALENIAKAGNAVEVGILTVALAETAFLAGRETVGRIESNFAGLATNYSFAESGNFAAAFVREGAEVEAATDTDNVQLIELPEGIGDKVLAAQAIFDARFTSRTDELLVIKEAVATITKKMDELPGVGDFTAFRVGLVDKLAAIQDILEQLSILEDVKKLADILDAFDDVASVFEAVQDAIEPVLDFFGPVTDLINEAVEAVEEAIGLDTLKRRIQQAVDDQIDKLTKPLTDALDQLLEDLKLPEIQVLGEIFESFQTYQDTVQAIFNNPIALTETEPADVAEELNGAAVIVSSSGNDTIRLTIDTDFAEVDGLGGYVLADNGDKKITGTDLGDLLLSGSGDDTVYAKNGDDVVVTGTGDDVVGGGRGNDAIAGKQGNDTLRGDAGDDLVFGGLGKDVLFGGEGDDTLYGDGSDTDNVPAPGEGLNLRAVEEYADYLEAGAGDDELYGGFGIDTLVASSGNNTLDGGEGVDEIRTIGEADATHTVLDSTARIFGGAGKEILELEDDYGLGELILDGVVFDAGANFDTIKSGSLDLDALDSIDPLTGLDRIQNFETLHITAMAGTTKTLITDVDSLNNFKTLILENEGVEFSEADSGRSLTPEEYGAIIIEVSGGDFVMSGFGAKFPLIINNSAMADLVNPHDGDEVDGFFPFFNSFVHSSKLNALTIRAVGDLATSGAILTGNQATTDGFFFEGGSGVDTITGGGGSDIIRAGLGADIINGGVSDSGNKFSNDSAVGDIIIGTLADFNGDQIFNLTNRVDRIRIEGSQEYLIEMIPVISALDEITSTTINVYASGEVDTDGNIVGVGAILSTFVVDGDNPKLTFRGGSYIPLGTSVAVDFVELFNNNVPPTAVSDLVETRNLGDGDLDGTLFDPFENDFDADADIVTNDDGTITRREIDDAASVLALLNELSAADPNMPAVEVGARFETELGNVVFYTQIQTDDGLIDQLFYESRDPSVTLRMIKAEDAVGGLPTDIYDPTEGLPFFGLDRIVYTNIDKEAETSDFAAINFIIRPDRITDGNAEKVLPSVTVFGDQEGQIIEQVERQLNELAPNTSATVLDDRLTSGNVSPNASLDTAFVNSDYLDIDAAGTYFGFSDGDVIDARDATGRVALFGGDGADWVEGGSGDDFLSGGGVDDFYLTPATRTNDSKLPVEVGPSVNILLGGAGDNVFSASLGQLNSGFNNKTAGRDTVYVLNGGAETVLGPVNSATDDANDDLSFFPYIPFDYSATAALALDGDKVFGFDNDDKLVIPTNIGSLFWEGRSLSPQITTTIPGAGVEIDVTVNFKGPDATSLVLVDSDTSIEELLSLSEFRPSPRGDYEVQLRDNVVAYDSRDSGEVFVNTFNLTLPDEQRPEILAYDIVASPQSDKSTIVSVSLSSFGYDVVPELQGISDDTTVTGGDFNDGFPFSTYETVYDLDLFPRVAVRDNNSFLDPRGLFGGGPIKFDIEFEGKYNPDRFKVELAPLDINGDFVDVGGPVGVQGVIGTSGDEYLSYDISEYQASTPQALGIAIVYDSSAAITFDDAVSVERGRAVTFNVFDDNGSGADSDADNDSLQIFDLVFDDAMLEAALLDGDDSNGELILENDLNTGLGTGAITFIAPENFYGTPDEIFGEVSFGYIATDQEFQSERADVTIDVTGLRPQLGDDQIILAADTNGLITIAQLLANDSDPDFVNGAGTEFDLSSISFNVLGDEGLKGDITPDGTGYQLRNSVITELLERDTDAFGGNTEYTTFTYRVKDIDTGASSDRAIVEVAIAEELIINSPFAVASAIEGAPVGAAAVTPLVVKEDGSIAIDVLANRSGGYGDVELSISPTGKAFAKGTTIEVGDLVVSGDEVIFTPIADLSNFTAEIEVTATDQAGQTVDLTFEVFVDPVEDQPVILLLSFTNGVASLNDLVRTDEDVEVDEDLYIYDPDAVTDLSLDVASGFLSDVVTYVSEVASLATLEAVARGTAQLAGQNAFGDVDLVTARGGDFSIFAQNSETFYQYSFLGLEDQNGADLLEIAFLPLTEGGKGDVLEIEIFIDPVNDAPVFVDDLGDDPFVPKTALVDIGEAATFNLLESVVDIDGDIDASSLVVSAGADTSFATVDLNTDTGALTLTGVASGSGTLTYSVTDDQGLTSGPRDIDFKVNSAPTTVDDRFVVAAPFAPILIDAIANDTDADGVLSYVLGEGGLPTAIDPQSSLGFESDIDRDTPLDLTGKGGLLGRVEWSVADQAFVYTAPTDISKLGQSDQFFYEVKDDDGSVARGLVTIDLISSDPNVSTLRVIDKNEGTIEAFAGAEVFVLGDGPRIIEGDSAALNGDRIADFSPEDSVLITGAPAGAALITTIRQRGEFPAAPNVTAIAPTAAQIFGDTPIDTLTSAFVGDTLLNVTAGGVTTTLRLDGAFLGEFTATSTPDGLVISYAATATNLGGEGDDEVRGDGTLTGNGGDDILIGGAGADDLQGGDGRDVLIGKGGTNTLTGGQGADLFILSDPDSLDTITDYNPAEGDRIVLSDGEYLDDDLAALLSLLTVKPDGDGFLIIGEIPETDTSLATGSRAIAPGPTAQTLARFELSVAADETPPRIESDVFSIVEGQTDVGTVIATDGQAGITYSISGGSDGSLFAIDSASGALTFVAAPDFEAPADLGGDNLYQVEVTAKDLSENAASQLLSVTITPKNDPISITSLPTDIEAVEETASDLDLSDLTLTDVGGNTGFALTLTADTGAMAATSSGSVTVIGSGTGALVLTGLAADIDTFLNTAAAIQYTGSTDVAGDNAAKITLTANDGFGVVSLGSVNLDISAVNDAPTVTGAPSDVVATEDTASNVDLSAMSFADVDGDALTVTLAASAGLLAATTGGGVTVGGTGTGSLTLSGTSAAINTYLDTANNIQYTGASNVNGDDAATLTVSASDGNTGVLVSNPVINLDISAVNDAPTASGVPRDVEVLPEAASNFDLTGVTLVDVEDDALIFTLTASTGIFEAADGTGVVVGGTGSSMLTLEGQATAINAYLSAVSQIQYTGASDARSDNAATVTASVGDSTDLTPLGSINVDIVNTNGTSGTDYLIGTASAETIEALAGNDTVNSGAGADTISLGAGSDVLTGTLSDFDGDTVTDFRTEDQIVFEGLQLTRDAIAVTRGPVIVELDVDGDGDGASDSKFTLDGDFSGGDFMAVADTNNTVVTFETFLPALLERQAINPDLVNGIINQNFLKGDGSIDFKVTLRDLGFAGYNNVVGVYEITASGDIVDTRILFENANADKGAVATITDVEAGNFLGFFIVQDAADWASTLDLDDTLSFINGSGAAANISDGRDVSISVNGAAVDEMVFHSFSDDLNSDGVQHVLSGVDVGGKAISVGFEDLTGGGDADYEDVVFRVDLVGDLAFV